MRLFGKKEVYFDEYDENANYYEYEKNNNYEEDNYYDEYEENIEYDMNRLVTIVNIVFTILVVLMAMIAIDVICVSRYSVGPFFAIKTHTYKDGGTKVYHGIGYKVIKYNQTEGRKDKAIGSWNLKYNVTPIKYDTIDLAIALINTPEETYKDIGNQFIKIKGKVSKINDEKSQIIIIYRDKENPKYNLNITCTKEEQDLVDSTKKGDDITLVGTVKDFYLGNEEIPNKLYINHCIKK